MEEFVVVKQGSIKSGNWTQRVLSLHPNLGLAAITSKDAQDDKLYECVRVANVQVWPQYQGKHIKESYQSTEAKLTVRAKGLPAKIGIREVKTPTGDAAGLSLHASRTPGGTSYLDASLFVLRGL
ncbi:hypothetical protein ABB37_09130 [Leptomonas pyrrhocoris]|uniref:Uncharacterized protein n=1 Tax=Leptomonas pyrrhocoris TaxID=157538 RepID=A0A0M9FRC8_LEPPY|nr:hypothetical protein ABB37_09130 [Leptomonas pyrrhocoris]KPA74443.1 hypothetical protein ABB37_09130 [Leptomonas pyrrhocoris]|eukprot:XP_015652882.1 hypothetical protein ABB37_09130 [Leptomonas pyrrhocoris]